MTRNGNHFIKCHSDESFLKS